MLLLDHEHFGPETRARCARQLLSNTNAIGRDKDTLLKFKTVFFHDLTDVANYGDARPPFLQAAVAALRVIAASHTQHVESANKIVSSETERAPQIKPELTSASLCLKKTLRRDGGSNLAAAMFGILSTTIEPYYGSMQYRAIANDKSRFAPPTATDFNAVMQRCSAKPTPLCLQDTPALQCLQNSGSDFVGPLDADAHTVVADDVLAWAYCWNLVWSRHWLKRHCIASSCIQFTLASGDVQRWLCCMKFYSEGTLHRPEQLESASQTLLRLRRPQESIESSELFANLRRTWGDTTQNITCDKLTLEWHRTLEYGHACKIVSSQPMFGDDTMKFDVDHAVSVLNCVAAVCDGAAAAPKSKAAAKSKQQGKAKGKAKAQMKQQPKAKVTRAAVIQRVRKKLIQTANVFGGGDEHGLDDDNDDEDGHDARGDQLTKNNGNG